jgi:dipeptidyl aminopeptidase/acylaminoacyl peptidase
MKVLRQWMAGVLLMWGVGALTLLGAGGAQAQSVTTPVPVEAFFKPAQMRSAALSPSGRWLAALSSEGKKRVGFVVIDLEGKEGTRQIEANDKDDVTWFRWVSDDWIVFRVYDPNDRSTWGLGGGLMAMTRDGKTSRMLVSREWGTGDMVGRRVLEPNHSFVALGAPGSDEIIVEEWKWDVNNRYTHGVLKVLNVATSAMRTLLDDAPRASDWLLDHKGRPRVAVDYGDTETTVWWADAATGKWREIDKAPKFERKFAPEYVQDDDTLMVTTRDGQGYMELRRFDFATGRPAGQPAITTPGFSPDVTAVREPNTRRLLGVQLLVDSWTTQWFDPTMRDLQARADARFPGRVNLLSCSPCDKPKSVLVFSYADTDPGMYVLYRPGDDKWQLIGRLRPEIEPSRMAELELFRTKARDGRDLPVWLTRPPQPAGAATKPAPTVVLVHGGPHVRGTQWEWDAEAQFLASRGYLVIEPEFRGSTGYGERHFKAGFKQWGLAMQDDITDALRFAVGKGWADADRVCIMGASYGGYASLMGLVKDPDQYRCGIAHIAVADPRFMFDFSWSDISPQAKAYSLPVTLGDRKADDAKLAATSPLEQAARIKAPVLLVHGGIDRRVPIQNGERMRDALQKNGKVYEWLVYPDEGHGFRYDNNRFDYYRRIEAFLAKHLK